MMRIIVALTVALSAVSGLKIGAFNIQSFGDSKMTNPEVSSVILKILPRYDIVVVQEVRDSDLSAVELLMTSLNRECEKPLYSYVVSDTLGRDAYKEQYLFIYRHDKVTATESYHYHDHNMYTGEDVFSREPFVVMFSCSETVIPDFVLVPLHAAPKDAVREIDALYDVYLDVCQKWQTDNIIFLGDFNAGCSYVGESDWDNIRLHTGEEFQWLIPHDVDTTVGKTFCPYDRIVISGANLQNAIVADSAQVFNFQEMYELTLEQTTEREETGVSELLWWFPDQQPVSDLHRSLLQIALAVSDHYPVELELMIA